ncbi:MAG: MBL fold metallo-hydrolase, partial [Candidatus Roizmanbacteria bacterium]
MSSIEFLGASGTVTGSCYRYTSSSGVTLLIDCGMYQGPADITALNSHPLPQGIDKLDAVLLTHAHLDHCGRLPLVVQQGYTGPIYMTAPTQYLIEVTLKDAAKVA